MTSLRMSTGKEMKRDSQEALRDFGCFQLSRSEGKGMREESLTTLRSRKFLGII